LEKGGFPYHQPLSQKANGQKLQEENKIGEKNTRSSQASNQLGARLLYVSGTERTHFPPPLFPNVISWQLVSQMKQISSQ
jgi:hypothetical protein